MKTLRFLSLLLAGLVFLCVGCGGPHYKVCQIEGTLLYNGTPVPETDISFVPANGDRGALAHTDAQGHFKVRYTQQVDGIPPGDYKISLSIEPQIQNDATKARDELPDFQKLLERYSINESPLTVSITKPDKEMKLEVSLN
jgi:hypothetical protein